MVTDGPRIPPAGVMAALATPVRPDGRLDEEGLRRLVGHVVAGGADGISPVGSTGEGARLTRRQRADVTAQVRSLVPAGMPVIAGAHGRTGDEALADLDALAGAGATAALVSVQACYPLPDNDIAALYTMLADRTPLPLLLYNIPAFTGLRLPPEIVRVLAAHPNVVGIKDSSRDVEYLQELVIGTAGTDFRVLTGTDTLLVASLALGAHGTIAGSVNLVPELSTGIHRAFRSGDLATARTLQERLVRIVAVCRQGHPPSGWKAALAAAGICGPDLVPPASPLPEPRRAELAAKLTDLGVLTPAR